MLDQLHEEGKAIDITTINIFILATFSRVYERLIILCPTQTTYEDAFFYLEEMKGHTSSGTVGLLKVQETKIRTRRVSQTEHFHNGLSIYYIILSHLA